MAFWAVDARYKEFSRNAQLNELAGNGYFDFWHAFRTNEIDYERYYRVLPDSQAVATLAMEISGHKPGDLQQHPNQRRVDAAGPERRLNVVLVSVESLSAEFLGSFGNTQGLTPNLDRLAQDGLLFTKLYATGTRTVRGLEALTLSVPPTPGQSIVKRPDNADLFTIGEVFKSKGYEALYLYGGYGYFDNMNAFFAGNGYTVVDRTALPRSDIHFENIWGVADEDLFTLTLRELDAAPRARHALLRACDDHVEPPALHLPGRAHRHPVEDRARRRREVHRLRDRPLHRRGPRPSPGSRRRCSSSSPTTPTTAAVARSCRPRLTTSR